MKNTPLLLAALLLCTPAFAQLQTKTVSIFKNGQSFFAKEGNVPLQQGTYTISGTLPAGLFGTIWFTSKDGKIKQITSSQDSIAEQRDVNSMGDLLQANIGKSVVLQTMRGQAITSLSGTIQKVFANAGGGKFVEIKTADDKYLVISELSISDLSFSQVPQHSISDKSWGTSLSVKFTDASASNKHLGLIYLRNDLGWSPNYLLELQGEKKGKLTLRAEIVNNAESFENATVNFVVGNPNFSQATRLSPLVDFGANAYYADANAYSRRDYAQQSMSNMSFDAIAVTEEDTDEGFTLAEGVEGKSAEDLFFYTQKDFSLKNGQRAFANLLEADVEVEHIYESNLSTNQISSGYYQKEYTPIDNNSLTRVYHSIRLKNGTTMPWTTGSTLVLTADGSEQKPLSQDVLRYTPPKGECTIKLTASPDIHVEPSEKETDREEQKLKIRGGQVYDLVMVDGQIKVKNYKSTAVKLSLNRTIQGETIKSNTTWKVNALLNLGGQSNKTSEIKWDVELKPGEEKVIDYSYKVYVLTAGN